MSDSKKDSKIGGLSASELMKMAMDESSYDDTSDFDIGSVNGSGSKGENGNILDQQDNYNFFGDYELLEPVGSGGMGIVFRARQVTLDREVAVKLITAGGFADARSRKRFRREAENAAKLAHPNIVQVYEVGEDNGQPFYSMEFIQGLTLADMIREQPLPWKMACRYLISLAEAVHYAHKKGVLHRDLKPQNVMIDAFDNVRITDFGLSEEVGSTKEFTVTGQMLGTPDYVPLEQLLGKKSEVGVRSEVYSLGAILYACLTGRPPVHGDSIAEVVDLHRNAMIIPPKDLVEEIPKDLNTVCMKCLESDANHRYGSAEELMHELERVLLDKQLKRKKFLLCNDP